MKKHTSLLLITLLSIVIIGAAACGKTENNTAAAPKNAPQEQAAGSSEFKLPFEQPASMYVSTESAYDKNSIASTILENEPIPNTALPHVDNAKVDPAKYPLKGSHKEMELTCDSCHATGDYNVRVTQETCFTCHESYEVLAEKTAKLGYDDNIHAAPHYPKMDCDLCHKVHKEEGNVYCVTCHTQESMLKLKAP